MFNFISMLYLERICSTLSFVVASVLTHLPVHLVSPGFTAQLVTTCHIRLLSLHLPANPNIVDLNITNLNIKQRPLQVPTGQIPSWPHYRIQCSSLGATMHFTAQSPKTSRSSTLIFSKYPRRPSNCMYYGQTRNKSSIAN